MSKTRLKDIAEAAGVSINTVSRILTGKTKGLRAHSAEKIELIQKLSQEMNYTPNRAAQTMRTRRTYQVGLLAQDLDNPYASSLLKIVSEELARYRYGMLLRLISSDKDKWKSDLKDFSVNLLDGVLIHHPALRCDEVRTYLPDIPVIAFNRSPQDSPAMYNLEGGVLLALQHLRGLGHEKIAIVTGQPRVFGSSRRLTAYQSFYAAQSVTPPSDWILQTGWRYEDGEAAAEQIVKTECTACLAGNDLLAVGLCSGLRALGHEVPRDFSIVSIDDTILSRMNRPPLTSIHPPVPELVRLTVKSILAQIEDQEPEPFQMLMPSLTIRESAGPCLKSTVAAK